MGCCGQRIYVSLEIEKTAEPLAVLVKLHYTGLKDLNCYVGPITRQKYQFGLLRMFGYVDSREVDDFLKLLEDGKPAFSLVDGEAKYG